MKSTFNICLLHTLLATCRQGVFSFEEALPLPLFYQDFNDTNLLVNEAVCLVKENPGTLLDFFNEQPAGLPAFGFGRIQPARCGMQRGKGEVWFQADVP